MDVNLKNAIHFILDVLNMAQVLMCPIIWHLMRFGLSLSRVFLYLNLIFLVTSTVFSYENSSVEWFFCQRQMSIGDLTCNIARFKRIFLKHYTNFCISFRVVITLKYYHLDFVLSTNTFLPNSAIHSLFPFCWVFRTRWKAQNNQKNVQKNHSTEEFS